MGVSWKELYSGNWFRNPIGAGSWGQASPERRSLKEQNSPAPESEVGRHKTHLSVIIAFFVLTVILKIDMT